MGGGDEGLNNSLKNDEKKTSPQTDDRRTLSGKTIIDLFLMEQHNFFLKNWGTICRYSPEFKPLSKILDLPAVKIESIRTENNCLTAEVFMPMEEVILKSLMTNGGKCTIFPGGRSGVTFFNKEKNIQIIIYNK